MTQKHPFKDDLFGKDKNMLRCKIFIVNELDDRNQDDTICIYDTENDTFRIVYHCSDYTQRQRQFYLTRHATLNYIEDLLRSMKYDTEPFQYIQISTEMHPSVLYHGIDLEKIAVRRLIIDMIDTAMRHKIESIPIPQPARRISIH